MENDLKNVSLYSIAERYNNLLELADDPDVPQDTLNDALMQVEGAITDKVEAGCRYMMALDGACEALANEVKRLNATKKHLENRRKRIETAYIATMHCLNINSRIVPALGEIKIRKNPPSVVIDDMLKISDEYLRQKIEVVVDKTKIKTAFKDGEKVDGCHLATSERLVW